MTSKNGAIKATESKKMSSISLGKLKKPSTTQAPVISSGIPSNVDDDDEVMIDLDTPAPLVGPSSTANKPQEGEDSLMQFGEVKEQKNAKGSKQTAKVPIPPHRMTPLKASWPQIYTPLVEELGLLVRMNPSGRRIELKTSKHTLAPASSTMTKAINFLQCFNLGFAVEDAVALLRIEEIYIESFEIKDVKSLTGDHLSRAIGRIAGKDGRTRFTIENTSRTRIVLADTKIHILGSFASIRIARDAICALILGSPPGKVYHGLRTVAARQRERF